MDSLQEAITNIQVYQGVLNPPALVTSTCGFDAVYNTPNGNCDALPEKGSRQCPRAKPAMESETCTQRHKTVRMANLRTLLQLTTVPDAFGFNAGNAKRRLSEITAHSAAIAIGNGLIYAGQDEIYTYMVRPRVGYSGNTTATIQFSTADYKFHGRQLRFAYNVSAVDIKGNPFTFGPYFAVATFLSCSPRVESVYSSSQLSVYTMQAMSHTWPVPQKTKPVVGLRRLHQDTNSTEIVFGEQAPAPTSSPTDSSPTPSPPQASPPIPAPAPAPVPSPPGSISPPPPTPATTPSPPPSPPLPPVVFPPPPPSYSTDAMSTQDWGDGDYITLEDLADYFIAAANAVLQSPAMQSYQFTFAKGCVPSVIDNLQFCDVASGQGLFNIDSVGILGDTCTALCADGAWDAAGQWTCDVGCKAATDAACSSCKSGCSAACNTCKGSCNAACDACKGSVKTACESCKVACCYGCVWGKTCNCDSVCDPNKVCGKDCGCGGCDATCNCDQDCQAACNPLDCPDCDLQCQENCKDELAKMGINYKYSADFVKGLGDMTLTSVTNGRVTYYVTNKTEASVEFDTAAKWDAMQVRIGFSASLAPDYGLPPIPFTYITIDFTNTFYVKKATFNITHDCVVPWDEKATGKLIVTLPEFELESTWVSWQAIYDTMFEWVDFLGNSWLEDASKAIAKEINKMIDDQSSGLLQNILNGVLKSLYFGSVDCSVYQ